MLDPPAYCGSSSSAWLLVPTSSTSGRIWWGGTPAAAVYSSDLPSLRRGHGAKEVQVGRQEYGTPGELADVDNAVLTIGAGVRHAGGCPLCPLQHSKSKVPGWQHCASSSAPDAHAASSQVSQAEDALAIRDHHNLPRPRWGCRAAAAHRWSVQCATELLKAGHSTACPPTRMSCCG